MIETKLRFGILYSWASPDAAGCGPDLIAPQRYASRVEAESVALATNTAAGSESEVMQQTDDGWRSLWGETVDEVINRRWTPHGAHECKFVKHKRLTASSVFRNSNDVWLCSTCGKRRYQGA